MDKRDRALVFRQRLANAMRDKEVNQSQLSRAVGVDRSTISQLLSREARLATVPTPLRLENGKTLHQQGFCFFDSPIQKSCRTKKALGAC